MTIINDRQGWILNKLVESHIDLAEPISSEYLQTKYQLSLSCATIRGELQWLTETEYLYQPHPSAGRIPTDKGYRFFVDSLEEVENGLDKRTADKISQIKKEAKNYLFFLQESHRLLSLLSSGLVVSYLPKTGIFIKSGWKKTLSDPEFSDVEKVKNFLSMVDYFEEKIDEFDCSSVKIYIGNEAPISKSKDFSIIISGCSFWENKEGVVAILGLKRMNYDRNISLIKSIVKILKENNL